MFSFSYKTYIKKWGGRRAEGGEYIFTPEKNY